MIKNKLTEKEYNDLWRNGFICPICKSTKIGQRCLWTLESRIAYGYCIYDKCNHRFNHWMDKNEEM